MTSTCKTWCVWIFCLFGFFCCQLFCCVEKNMNFSCKETMNTWINNRKMAPYMFILRIHCSFCVCGQCETAKSHLWHKHKKNLTFSLCTRRRHAKEKFSWLHGMSSCCNCDPFMERSLLPATVGAQDVVTLGEEAASHQRHRALHAGETLAVPLALLKRDVLGPCQTCTHQTKIHIFKNPQFNASSPCLSDSSDTNANESLKNKRENCVSDVRVNETWLTGDGLGAAHTLLCIQVAEAFKAVGVVFPGGEALTWQLLSAADA